MNHRNSPAIKIISAFVFFFFTWSFGGVFDIAYAINNSQEAIGNSSVSKTKDNKQSKTYRTEEKFQKATEDIDQFLNDSTLDTERKKVRLKAKKTEIESFDVEIKKQFADTEKKLKDDGMPSEILQRHRKFVKQYEDNLKELKDTLDALDKAKTKAAFDAESDKAKKFLEKVKPPREHQPFDPEKMPHRTAEPVFKEPRMNPDEFEKEQKEKSVAKQQIPLNPPLLKGDVRDDIPSVQFPTLEKGGKGGFSDRPILIASNGPLTGLLSPNTSDAQTILLAEASNPPTADDLAETIEIQLTPEIRAKAQELGYNPVKIYNWVRNNIEYVPTFGSIQGANMCMQTKQCNDFDTASLLTALLRASNIPAKYVYGTIEIPIEKVKNWVGGFTDTNAALNLIASGKTPVAGVNIGGKITAVRMEHMWVEAWIDYLPSRGARHKTGKGDTWIPLDASFKQYNYTQGIDIKTAVPFDAQAFVDQIQSTATINEAEGYVTNVNSLFIQQTMADYQTQVQNYITQNYPNATVGDVLGKKEIIKEEHPYLLGTLPYKTIVKGAKYSSIPDNLRHKIVFSVIKDAYDEYTGTPINITKSLPELAGKKITLSYSPATAHDEDVINSYLPKPHADGTPIQPSELPSSLPAYLINLKPELRIDGTVIATGTDIVMGNKETFRMTFTAPNQSADVITNDVHAGEYLGIGLDTGRISQDQMQKLKTKLEATKAKLEAQDFTNLTKDDILGDLLYTTAISYFAELNAMDFVTAKTTGVNAMRLPSANIFSNELSITSLFGIPRSASSGGLAMDVDRDISVVKALDGDTNKAKQFMLASGMNSSALEHSVPEQLFSTTENPAEGISAVKALQLANEQGIPIYSVNQTNIASILPQLQIDANVKTDIQNAVNAGKEVTVSKTDISLNGWTGCGYIIIDPVNGTGAYMISGGMNGSWVLFLLAGSQFLLALVFIACGAIPLAAMFVVLGLIALYGAMVYAVGKEKTDEFIGCLGLSLIGTLEVASVIFDYYLPTAPYSAMFKVILKALWLTITTNDDVQDFRACLSNL